MWPFKKKLIGAPMPVSKFSAEMIAEAKKNPNGWVYVIEGNFGPNDAVPPDRIKGAWKVDGSGALTDEFQENPKYRPGTAS